MSAHGAPIAFLVGVHLILFLEILVKGADGSFLSYVYGDFDASYHRVFVFISDSLRAGALPIWDPYMAAGLPNYINPQSFLWWPVTWFVSLGLGYSHAVVQRQLVVTLILGGVGAYGLAFTLYSHRLAALAAALSFSLSNGVFMSMKHLDILNACAQLPWLFWGVVLLGKPGHWGPLLLPVVIFSLIVSGYPAVVTMALLWAFAWHLDHVRTEPNGRERGVYVARMALAWALGGGMAAVHWLPILLNLHAVKRGAAFSVHDAMRSSLHLSQMTSIFYNFTPQVSLPGRALAPAMRGVYGGIVLLPFVLLALHAQRGKYFCRVATLAGGCFLMTLGDEFFGRVAMHNIFPFLNFSRFPGTDSRGLFVLAMALLGCSGLSIFMGDTVRYQRLILRVYAGLGILLLISIVALRKVLGGTIDVTAFDGLVAGGITAQILCLALASMWVVRQPRGLAGLVLVLTLDMGTCVSLNFDNCLAVHLSPPMAQERQRTETGFPVALARQSRFYDPAAVRIRTAFKSHTEKRRYLNYYGGFVLNSFEGLLDSGFTDWLASGEHVVSVPEPCELRTGEELAKRMVPVQYVVKEYLPDRVHYEVNTPEDTTLVFNEIFFEGWQAVVDGAEQPMFGVANGLRALQVNAGFHDIKTVFRPTQIFWTLAVSFFSFCAWVAWLVYLRWDPAEDSKAGGLARSRGPRLPV